MSESRTLYREANPEPDYVGGVLYPREAAAVQMWVVPVSVDGEIALDILEVDEGSNNVLQLAAHDLGIEPGVYALIAVAALGGTDE